MAQGMLQSYASDLNKVQKEFDTGDRGLIDYVLGTGYYGVAKPVEELVSFLTPDAIEEPIAQATQYAMDKTGASDYLQSLDPEDRRRIEEGLGLLGVVSPVGRMKGRATAPTDPAMRGYALSSGEVIVPNFYNPRDRRYSAPVETALTKAFPDEYNPNLSLEDNIKRAESDKTKQNVTQNKIRKGLGFVEWGTQGAVRVAQNMFNPYSRALYAESGLSPVFKEAKKQVDVALAQQQKLRSRTPPPEGTPERKAFNQENLEADRNLQKAIEVAHSQVQQMHHIRRQAEAKGRGKDVTEGFALASADPNVPQMYFKPNEVGSDWYLQTGAKGANRYGIKPDEAQFVGDHVLRVWSGLDPKRARVIVKKPRSTVSGMHWEDLTFNNAKTQVAELFDPTASGKRKEFTVDSLAARLEKKSKNKTSNFAYVGKDSTGAYIQFSKAGRGKVEGGVNVLMKVHPNGDLTGYLSDLHDFLEKTPVLGKMLDKAMPTQVLAVTPPMQTNIYSVRTKKTIEKKYGEEGLKKRVSPPQIDQVGEQAQALKRIQEAGAVRPSTREVLRQTAPMANTAADVGMLMGVSAQEQE